MPNPNRKRQKLSKNNTIFGTSHGLHTNSSANARNYVGSETLSGRHLLRAEKVEHPTDTISGHRRKRDTPLRRINTVDKSSFFQKHDDCSLCLKCLVTAFLSGIVMSVRIAGCVIAPVRHVLLHGG